MHAKWMSLESAENALSFDVGLHAQGAPEVSYYFEIEIHVYVARRGGLL